MKRRPQRRTRPRITGRDHALVSEIVGYLRGVASGYNDDSTTYRWSEVLASRLDRLRLRLWPLDR